MAATQLYGAGYPSADKPHQLYGSIYHCRFVNLLDYCVYNEILLWVLAGNSSGSVYLVDCMSVCDTCV